MLPNKPVIGISLPATGLGDLKSPNKIDFSEQVELHAATPAPRRVRLMVSNAEKPATPPLQRLSKDSKSVERYNPPLTQVPGSRKKLRNPRPKSPITVKSVNKPCFMQANDLKELYEKSIINYVCLTSLAKGHGGPVDANMLDIVDMSKAFAQISKNTAKPEVLLKQKSLNLW